MLSSILLKKLMAFRFIWCEQLIRLMDLLFGLMVQHSSYMAQFAGLMGQLSSSLAQFPVLMGQPSGELQICTVR